MEKTSMNLERTIAKKDAIVETEQEAGLAEFIEESRD